MKNILIFIFVICLVKPLSSQTTYFDKLYGEEFPTTSSISGITAFYSNFYIFSLSKTPNLEGVEDKIEGVSIDSLGETQWHKYYGAPGGIYGTGEIISLSDSNLMLTGFEVANGKNTAFLMKLSADGDSLWRKNYYSFYQSKYFVKIIETSDHGILCLGLVKPSTAVKKIGYAMKADSTGNMEWELFFSDTNNPDRNTVLMDAIELPTSDFIIIGHHSYLSLGSSYYNGEPVILNVDTLGELLSDVIFPDEISKSYGFLDISVDSEDNWIVSGFTKKKPQPNIPLSGPFFGGLLCKFNPEGELIWKKTYTGETERILYYANSVDENGEIYCVGHSQGDATDDYPRVTGLAKFDTEGELKWFQGYDRHPNIQEYLYHMVPSHDGNGFILAGLAFDSLEVGNTSSKGWVLKVDSLGCRVPLCITSIDHLEIMEEGILVFPNPFVEQLTIQLPEALHGEFLEVRLYDVLGKLQYATSSQYASTIELQLPFTPTPGYYFLEVRSKEGSWVEKVLSVAR